MVYDIPYVHAAYINKPGMLFMSWLNMFLLHASNWILMYGYDSKAEIHYRTVVIINSLLLLARKESMLYTLWFLAENNSTEL